MASEVGEFRVEVGEFRCEVGEFGLEAGEMTPEVVVKISWLECFQHHTTGRTFSKRKNASIFSALIARLCLLLHARIFQVINHLVGSEHHDAAAVG